MYKFWYDYLKPKYGEKAKLCYMDKNSFIVYIKICDLYVDIIEYVKQGLIFQIINQIDHCLKERIKK